MTAVDAVVYVLAVIGALTSVVLLLGLLGVVIFRSPQRSNVIDVRDDPEAWKRFNEALSRATLTTDPSSMPKSELTRRIEERSRGLHPTGRGAGGIVLQPWEAALLGVEASCTCGDPDARGVTHKTHRPCYINDLDLRNRDMLQRGLDPRGDAS